VTQPARRKINQFGFPHGPLGHLAGLVMRHGNTDMEQAAVDALTLHGSERVLEIGPGPGVGLRLLADRLPGGHATGLDPSPGHGDPGPPTASHPVKRRDPPRRNARTALIEGNLRRGDLGQQPHALARRIGRFARPRTRTAARWPTGARRTHLGTAQQPLPRSSRRHHPRRPGPARHRRRLHLTPILATAPPSRHRRLPTLPTTVDAARSRPDRHHRTTSGPAPAPRLAVAARLAGPVGYRHPPLTTTAEQGPRNGLTWKSRTDRRILRAHPNSTTGRAAARIRGVRCVLRAAAEG